MGLAITPTLSWSYDPIITVPFLRSTEFIIQAERKDDRWYLNHPFQPTRFSRWRGRAGRQFNAPRMAELPCSYWDHPEPYLRGGSDPPTSARRSLFRPEPFFIRCQTVQPMGRVGGVSMPFQPGRARAGNCSDGQIHQISLKVRSGRCYAGRDEACSLHCKLPPEARRYCRHFRFTRQLGQTGR